MKYASGRCITWLVTSRGSGMTERYGKAWVSFIGITIFILTLFTVRAAWHLININTFGADDAFWFDWALNINKGHLALTHLGSWLDTDRYAFMHPPAYPLLLSGLTYFIQDYWFYSGKILSLILGGTYLFLFLKFARKILPGTLIATAVTLTLLFDPFFDGFSVMPSYGMLLIFLSFLSLATLVNALENGGKVRYIIAGILTGLSCLTLYTAISILLGNTLFLFIHSLLNKNRPRLLPYLFGFFLTTAPYALWILLSPERLLIFKEQISAVSYGMNIHLTHIIATPLAITAISPIGYFFFLPFLVPLLFIRNGKSTTFIQKWNDHKLVILISVNILFSLVLTPFSYVAAHRLILFHSYACLLLFMVVNKLSNIFSNRPRLIVAILLSMSIISVYLVLQADVKYNLGLLEQKESGQLITFNSESTLQMSQTLQGRFEKDDIILAPVQFRYLFPNPEKVFDVNLINVCGWTFYSRNREIEQIVQEDIKKLPGVIILPDTRFRPEFSAAQCTKLQNFLHENYQESAPLHLQQQTLQVFRRLEP